MFVNKLFLFVVDRNITLRIIVNIKQRNVSLGGVTLREWLSNARKNLELTQQDVADKTQIKRQYYGMIENGDRTPSVSTAKKIANVLEIDWILFFEDKSNKMFHKSDLA
jgi:putative transcriptional regulator